MSYMREINELLYKALEAQEGEIDTESGVVFNFNIIESLQLQREDRLEGLLLYAEQKDTEAKLFADRAKAMMERAVTIKNKVEGLREYVAAEMDKFGDKKLEGKYLRATLCESKKTVIDESLLPREYFVEKVECRVDKERIKELLKSGQYIPGAALETSKYLRIK